MITIPIRVCGDKWTNFLEVKKTLETTPLDTEITFDFLAEGPSLGAIGLLDMLQNRDSELITITNNPNTVERSPFKNITPAPSHFFHMAKRYWSAMVDGNAKSRKFGFFVGRRTTGRCYMLWKCQTQFADHFLFSLMHTIMKDPWHWDGKSLELEHPSHWMSQTEFEEFLSWWNKKIIYSLDGHAIDHQYKTQYNTNLDLIKHYEKFHVELVAETYTLGDTFFPTEKTIRPLVTGKPIIVYGPCNHLSRLKDLGFQTWNDYWSESYDKLQGKERWLAIENILASLVSMPDNDFAEMIKSMGSKRQHNRTILKRLGRIHDR